MVDDVDFFIMLKNLKVKEKTTLECNISFDFSMRMLDGPVGSEKPVGFFSVAHSDVSQVSQAQGRRNQVNFPQNIHNRAKVLPDPLKFFLGYACGISSFLIFGKFLC